VGEVLEDRRDRVSLRIFREPDPRREARAVRQRDPGLRDDADAARELGADVHRSRGPRIHPASATKKPPNARTAATSATIRAAFESVRALESRPATAAATSGVTVTVGR